MYEAITAIDRRAFLRTAAITTSALAALPAAAHATLRWRGPASQRDLRVDGFRQSGDTDWSPAFQRAVNAAQQGGGGTVQASTGRVYGLRPQVTYPSLDPSGGNTRFAGCVQIPAGVTVDMRGSTLQLLGGTEASLVANANLTGRGPRDAGVGLVNAVLDGGDLPSRGTPMLHLGYVDALRLRNVAIRRGRYVGAWIYSVRNSTFDALSVNGFVGEPWLFGSPLGIGNEISDSVFGSLHAENVAGMTGVWCFPGNSFVFVLNRCRIASITAERCTAGIKIQNPTDNVEIGTIRTTACGDATNNSGLKLQGEPGLPVRDVTVAAVVAQDQAGAGLYMEQSRNCTIASYVGIGNSTNGVYPDVWVGGANDRIRRLTTVGSGAGGVMVRPYASGYQLDEISVRNPNRRRTAPATNGVGIYGGSGVLGSVTCVETENHRYMDCGVDVASASATGRIDSLVVRGDARLAFASASPRFGGPVSTRVA